MNRDILEKEFEPSQIKRRRGAFGEELDYVETADVIRRLNTAFDGVWSFEIIEYQQLCDKVVYWANSLPKASANVSSAATRSASRRGMVNR